MTPAAAMPRNCDYSKDTRTSPKSSLLKLDEEIAEAESLLGDRCETQKVLRSHHIHRSHHESGRLESQAHAAKRRLDVAQRAVEKEIEYRSSTIETRYGKRMRSDNNAALLAWADGEIGKLCRVAKRRRLAAGNEQKLVERHLEIVREELRNKRVVEVRREVQERSNRLNLLEAEALACRTSYEELCSDLAALASPGDLLSEADDYVAASQSQVEQLQRLRRELTGSTLVLPDSCVQEKMDVRACADAAACISPGHIESEKAICKDSKEHESGSEHNACTGITPPDSNPDAVDVISMAEPVASRDTEIAIVSPKLGADASSIPGISAISTSQADAGGAVTRVTIENSELFSKLNMMDWPVHVDEDTRNAATATTPSIAEDDSACEGGTADDRSVTTEDPYAVMDCSTAAVGGPGNDITIVSRVSESLADIKEGSPDESSVGADWDWLGEPAKNASAARAEDAPSLDILPRPVDVAEDMYATREPIPACTDGDDGEASRFNPLELDSSASASFSSAMHVAVGVVADGDDVVADVATAIVDACLGDEPQKVEAATSVDVGVECVADAGGQDSVSEGVITQSLETMLDCILDDSGDCGGPVREDPPPVGVDTGGVVDRGLLDVDVDRVVDPGSLDSVTEGVTTQSLEAMVDRILDDSGDCGGSVREDPSPVGVSTGGVADPGVLNVGVDCVADRGGLDSVTEGVITQSLETMVDRILDDSGDCGGSVKEGPSLVGVDTGSVTDLGALDSASGIVTTRDLETPLPDKRLAEVTDEREAAVAIAVVSGQMDVNNCGSESVSGDVSVADDVGIRGPRVKKECVSSARGAYGLVELRVCTEVGSDEIVVILDD